ncbi:polysaccharide deacetylase family protein [Rhizobium alvei]|uniref:Chitooligosaccharide deacetylase n=1 Tax=Rhizobium alvei TaxID=1132659 RepID=A0ABT8YH76_9HYPH|nr:polysaccharide deacetylase family protein [Rhizobium alvei]MDO6962767.1 polysaccharide deacetylase family protein [Rhizobium alvei]
MLKSIKALARPLVKRSIITAGLEAASLLNLAGLFEGMRGRGVIFTLHQVRPAPSGDFQPNDILSVTPEFLDTAIRTLAAQGYEFIALSDLRTRLASDNMRPFACFTLDDGYCNNRDHAAPVFRRHGVPYTIFITRGFVEATHSMWWETLEALLRQSDKLAIDFSDGPVRLPTVSTADKRLAFEQVAGIVNRSNEAEAVAALDRAALATGLDPLQLTRDLTMRADALQSLLADGLCSYGAHTISHRGLARLDADEAKEEIRSSAALVREISGREAIAFAYPYGDQRSVSPRERAMISASGLAMAVTTRPGVLTPDMMADMTALPRISLNGLYQKARYVRALASGIPFRLMG